MLTKMKHSPDDKRFPNLKLNAERHNVWRDEEEKNIKFLKEKLKEVFTDSKNKLDENKEVFDKRVVENAKDFAHIQELNDPKFKNIFCSNKLSKGMFAIRQKFYKCVTCEETINSQISQKKEREAIAREEAKLRQKENNEEDKKEEDKEEEKRADKSDSPREKVIICVACVLVCHQGHHIEQEQSESSFGICHCAYSTSLSIDKDEKETIHNDEPEPWFAKLKQTKTSQKREGSIEKKKGMKKVKKTKRATKAKSKSKSKSKFNKNKQSKRREVVKSYSTQEFIADLVQVFKLKE